MKNKNNKIQILTKDNTNFSQLALLTKIRGFFDYNLISEVWRQKVRALVYFVTHLSSFMSNFRNPNTVLKFLAFIQQLVHSFTMTDWLTDWLSACLQKISPVQCLNAIYPGP